jgi:hypothetical protein
MKSIFVLTIVALIFQTNCDNIIKIDSAQNDQISTDSYNRVASLVVSHFSERCKLALQNCIFQTQWDRLFNKDSQFYSSNTNKNKVKRTTSTSDVNMIEMNANLTYHSCKAYIVAKFCIDDYILKSEDYTECLNVTFGNEANEFKRSIDRLECKPYFEFYLNNSNDLNSRLYFVNYLFINLVLFLYY